MAEVQAGACSRPGMREQVATRIVFFVTGLAFASWAPLIPFVRSRLGLDDGRLGGLLLCLGVGSVIAMPLSGGFAGRFGCRRTILFAAGLACLALPLMVSAGTPLVLALSLAAFGAGLGTTDAVMNMQAVIVERASGRAMMSGFHGLFSVGGIAGAGISTLLLWLGFSPLSSTVTVVVLAVGLLAGSAPGLLAYGSEEDSPAFVLPHGHVILIGVLCFIMFGSEGAVGDWSGVLLNTVQGLEKSRAGVGYVAFSLTMTAGRLSGDWIVSRLGPWRVLFFGAWVAAIGFGVAALAPSWAFSVLGFALVGAGASNVVPVLFTAAGRQKAMPGNLAIAAVTTLGYTGVLAGPGLIGLIARASSLPLALLIVAASVLGVALSAGRAAA